MPVLSLSPSPYDTANDARATAAVPLRHTPTVLTAQAQRATPTGGAAYDLVLELVEDRLAFNALEGDWSDLFRRAGRSEQLFQSFGWLWHWCNHFLKPGDRHHRLAVVTGRRNGVLTVACPFLVTSRNGFSSLNFMGDPVSQYGDVLADDGPEAARDVEAAFEFALAATRVDVVNLRKVRSDAVLAPLLRELGGVFSDTQQAPYVAFNEKRDFSVFEQRYPKPARKNRKRQLRRLNETGATTFVRLAGGQDASAAVSVAMGLKREWLRQRGLVSPAIGDVRTEAFFRDCASGQGPATGVEIGYVQSDGAIAAIEIAIACKGRTAIHLIAYDGRFEKTGAGSLLMEDSIRRACESGIAAVDLLAPGTAYKFEWADRAVEVSDFALGLSAVGKLYTTAYLARLRPTAKSMVEHLPMTVRRQLSVLIGPAMFLADRGGVI